MSDTFDSDTDEELDGGNPNFAQLRKQAKEWERQAKANAEAAERAQKLEREIAFRDAGIDPKNPQQSYFMKGYDGDVSAEAIRNAAEQAGFLQPQAPPVPPQDLQNHQAIDEAAVGATPVPASGKEADMLEALRGAKNPQDYDRMLQQFGWAENGE